MRIKDTRRKERVYQAKMLNELLTIVGPPISIVKHEHSHSRLQVFSPYSSVLFLPGGRKTYP